VLKLEGGDMAANLPIVLVPSLNGSARLYAPQVPELWPLGSVLVADHTRDDSMEAIARRILDNAPPRFRYVGLSMGGYLAFEIMRQAPERVAKMAILDTSARADVPEIKELRRERIALARSGRFEEVIETTWEPLVHPSLREGTPLKSIHVAMCRDVGPENYIRQQTACMNRVDSRPMLGSIHCPTLVIVGAQDEPTPPELAEEIASGIPGARLVKVPECGHFSTLERPETVTRELVAFLQD
jgi:pimeloyl-ACP methyl ester carboxylesterase